MKRLPFAETLLDFDIVEFVEAAQPGHPLTQRARSSGEEAIDSFGRQHHGPLKLQRSALLPHLLAALGQAIKRDELVGGDIQEHATGFPLSVNCGGHRRTYLLSQTGRCSERM